RPSAYVHTRGDLVEPVGDNLTGDIFGKRHLAFTDFGEQEVGPVI
ncbi:MAG: hypothetical protein QOK02_1885, partial [Mycobacterium sp.]|nr:hypothetical protein [Mycobacterium sp.]